MDTHPRTTNNRTLVQRHSHADLRTRSQAHEHERPHNQINKHIQNAGAHANSCETRPKHTHIQMRNTQILTDTHTSAIHDKGGRQRKHIHSFKSTKRTRMQSYPILKPNRGIRMRTASTHELAKPAMGNDWRPGGPAAPQTGSVHHVTLDQTEADAILIHS